MLGDVELGWETIEKCFFYFFKKKKDGEEKQKTLEDALIYLSDHTFTKVPYYKNTTGIILI